MKHYLFRTSVTPPHHTPTYTCGVGGVRSYDEKLTLNNLNMKQNFIQHYKHTGASEKADLLSENLNMKLNAPDKLQKLLNMFHYSYKLDLFTDLSEKSNIKKTLFRLFDTERQEDMLLFVLWYIFITRTFLESNGMIEVLPYADELNRDIAEIIDLINPELDVTPLLYPMRLNCYVTDIYTYLFGDIKQIN